MRKINIGIKYNQTKDELIEDLISNKLNWQQDKSKNWACYFTKKPTQYIIKKDNQIFPISIEIIKLINDVRVGNKKYINGEFRNLN